MSQLVLCCDNPNHMRDSQQILHLNGFTDEEKERYKTPILRNLLDAMSQLLKACEDLHIVHEHLLQNCVDDFHEFYRNVDTADAEKEVTIPPDMCKKLQRLWKSSSVQMAYQRRWRFYLLDSAKYFLDAIVRITDKSYMPEIQDILQCRFPTKGTEEIQFNYENMSFTMIDVGGQRSERRKWIHVFDKINMMLFVAALSDYDLTDPENGSQNRLLANRYIFRTLVQSSFFRNAAIVLFFNKIDTFQEKLNNSPLVKHMTEYTGQNTVEECSKYLGNQFRACVKEKHKFFMFCTTATDTRNIEFMFGSALTHIINENLRATGSY
uniref:G-protein alpha subunit n=1 Tax=Panagrellus redivivus TaxID=6233 RepID=A0A7E4V3N4_PANRE